MPDTQSKIDELKTRDSVSLLQELNSQLVATIAELRKENAEVKAKYDEVKAENIEVKAENIKLRQALEEHENRFMNLEQKDKEKTSLIAKLDDDIKEIKQSSANANVSPKINLNNTPKQIPQNDSSKVLENTKPKSLEEKEVDRFLDSTHRENVSKEIIQSIKKKKLQEQDAFSISLEKPCSEKFSYEHIVAQDFIQEVSSEFTDDNITEVIDGNLEITTDMAIEVELAHLFLKVSIEEKNTMQAKQREISCRYSYGKRFKKEVRELMIKEIISEQTARKQLFQDIMKHLTGITLETLRKRTQRSIKLYELFEKIGIDKIKNIKTFSADSISKFTKSQIQIILDYFSETENVRPKVPLEQKYVDNSVSNTKSTNIIVGVGMTTKNSSISEISASTEVSISQVNTSNKTQPPISILPDNPEEKQKSVINKVLEQFPYLSLKYSNEYGDYFTCSEICPMCNKDHKKENIRYNVEGEWGSGDYVNTKTYRIKCWEAYQNSIQIVTVKA